MVAADVTATLVVAIPKAIAMRTTASIGGRAFVTGPGRMISLINARIFSEVFGTGAVAGSVSAAIVCGSGVEVALVALRGGAFAKALLREIRRKARIPRGTESPTTAAVACTEIIMG